MRKFIFLFSLALQLSSCSMHSNQYEFLKNMILSEDNQNKPKKNWAANWLGSKIELYAVNIQDQIIFADERINIFYKDMQIYKITGLLTEDSNLEIEFKDDSLIYFFDDRKIGVDYCESSYSLTFDKKSEKHSRSCYEGESGKIYENQVVFNSEGLIISMQFKIHPSYPLLQLSTNIK